MSLRQQGLYAVALLSSLCFCSSIYADCQTNDLDFTVDVTSMLPQAETVSTTATARTASNHLFSACTDVESLSIQYQMGQLADLSSQSIDVNGRRFYKIRTIQGVNIASAAINYLIEHAYVAFSLQGMNKTVPVNVAQDTLIDLGTLVGTENIAGLVTIGLSEIHFYFDALPNKDEIIDQLTSQNMRLKIGQLKIVLKDENSHETWSPSIAPSLIMNMTGIHFQRTTCFVQEQTVQLDPLVVTAIQAGKAAGSAKAFDLDLQCNGYLNQRELNLTWLDNNDLNNRNKLGYLSSVKGALFSNVGVQVTDEGDVPIQIGEAYTFESGFTGQQIKKSYRSRYYLAHGQPIVGSVNAQATLQIQYR